jgi:hypothetical protein
MKNFWFAVMLIVWSSVGQAEADGPDHFRVAGLSDSQRLSLHAGDSTKTAVLGQVPANGQCLRNLGCRGGLSFAEFSTLSDEAQKTQLEANPRWCKVEYRGKTGWVEGRFLTESACQNDATQQNPVKVGFKSGQTKVTLKGRIQGRDYVNYQVAAKAGQTLSVQLSGTHLQNYFNVLPPDTTIAMFVGSSAGNQFKRIVPADGLYVLHVYLMRSAARRNAASSFALQVDLTGEALLALPAKEDALISGTPFHASAAIACKLALDPAIKHCDAFVIRRGRDGTATLQINWLQGNITIKRRILLIKGVPVATDDTTEYSHSRDGDVLTIRNGADEVFQIPDALLFGGGVP